METIPVPAQLLQQILNYLTTRPWGEVNPMIASLMQIAQAYEETKKGNGKTIEESRIAS